MNSKNSDIVRSVYILKSWNDFSKVQSSHKMTSPKYNLVIKWLLQSTIQSHFDGPVLPFTVQFTYWGQDTMAAILQMTFINAFGSVNGLAWTRQQAIIWTNGG